MTAAFTLEPGQVAVFVAIDHGSAECVGLHAARRGTRHEALEPVRQGVVERFGGVETEAAPGLSLRHDPGRWDGCRPPQTASRGAIVVVCSATKRRGRQRTETMIGADLAKNVFQRHGASMTGQLKFRKKVTRPQLRQVMAKQPPAVVVMEACGSASCWARELIKLGHGVRLIAPQYVRPFVKRQSEAGQTTIRWIVVPPNDAAEAEAIVVAAQRPEMRFVPPKTEEQQARAMLCRGRERLVHQRTDLGKALRAQLYEFGHTVPQGIGPLKRIAALIEATNSDLPRRVREECRARLDGSAETTGRIAAKTKKTEALAAATDAARGLQTRPGVGPLTALAVDAFAPDMTTFRRGRDFAAWLGLVPRQRSSGGKARLGRVSKAGQADIRRRLILGAMSRLNWLGRSSIPEGSWLARLLAKKPRRLVAIALANSERQGATGPSPPRTARAIRAMLTKKEDHRAPAPAAAA